MCSAFKKMVMVYNLILLWIFRALTHGTSVLITVKVVVKLHPPESHSSNLITRLSLHLTVWSNVLVEN